MNLMYNSTGAELFTSTGAQLFSVVPILSLLLSLVSLAAGIYMFILLVKLAHLGIKALKIYIDKK